ncbi:DJ-1/PfpI family protein [Pseudoduganella namucuonensis]|uniref:Putative intracellular protease/amidase n=1 Tax=Pseudoduganella namucuonensis TaxID=1035707 RepID=A0A1I7HN75_9BURK|nr:DJ-1/PfpI family protein [Pseudoduganella namucuonensis]SFU62029.1 Putative intracellular protease/amidase [Pseudoduganella namucuonensis]
MKVFLVVLNTLADWEIGYITAELHSKRMFADPAADFALVKVGLSDQEIVTMGGMRIKPDIALDALRMGPDDLLLMPGGETWQRPETAPMARYAREQLDQGKRVAAICGATAALAGAGALDERPHTSNAREFLAMSCPAYAGGPHYREQAAVRDGNLITASGLAPLEFAYEVFKLLNVFRPATLEAWFKLYQTREPKYFHALMASME